MKTIRDVFDQEINRRIEKVIQYQTTDAELLEQEVREYIATDAIKSNLEKLLDEIDDGMSSPSERNVGVWVSGFYGSGKSSFTKYLGYALDSEFTVGGKLFRDLLKLRIDDLPLQQRLETVAKKHNPVVLPVDLSVDSYAQNHTMPVSTIMFTRVLHWAGYSRVQQVAYLEMMAEEDGRLDELKNESRKRNREWDEIHNIPIVAGSIGSQIAHGMYPDLFPTEESFSNLRVSEQLTERDQVSRMLELIRQRSGRDKVIFVIDEAGQYVAQSNDLVLNLQGFAQNLQSVGKGRAWLIATAQQTLTDSVGALNSPKLFKLKARFQVPVELKADDIKEITHRRLLSKTPAANENLVTLFDTHGAKLNVLTGLEEVRGYTTKVRREQFVDLYPFLPQHFDLMMNIIARLAKSTGGTGLRSAIKVVQETLVAGGKGEGVASRPLGELVTVVDFYNVLEQDLANSPQVRHTVDAVKKVVASFGTDSMETRVAKAVAVMQIMDDFPLTRRNLAALLVDNIDPDDIGSSVEPAIEALLTAKTIPLEEVERNLRFLSDKVATLQRQWQSYTPTSHDQRQVLTDVISDSVLTAQPRATIFTNKQVRAGVSLTYADSTYTMHESPDGMLVNLRIVSTDEYDSVRRETLNVSTHTANQRLIVALAAAPADLGEQLRDAYASSKMIRELRAATKDGDEEQFYKSMSDRERNAKQRIADALIMALEDGTVIYGGQDLPTKTSASSIRGALDSAAARVGEQVYDRYDHAAVTIGTAGAEKIIKAKDTSTLSSQDDPLDLLGGGGAGFQRSHPAVVDVRDYINQNTSVEGKKILDDLSKPPYGWTKDVSRYILAAMFVGGELSLRVGAQKVTATTSAVIDAFKSNQAFAKVGIDTPPAPLPPEVLKRTKDNLVRLTGKSVTPIPKTLEEAAREAIDVARDQAKELETEARLLNLGLLEMARDAVGELQNLSEAPQQAVLGAFGAEPSAITERILAVRKQHALVTGNFRPMLEQSTRLLSQYERLPESGVFGSAKSDTAALRESLSQWLKDEMLDNHQSKIQEAIDTLQKTMVAAAEQEWAELSSEAAKTVAQIQGSSDWADLTDDQRQQITGQLEANQAKFEGEPDFTTVEPAATVSKVMNAAYEQSETAKTLATAVSGMASENRAANSITYTVLDVPKLPVDRSDAEAVIEQLRKKIENAPDDRPVRFRIGD